MKLIPTHGSKLPPQSGGKPPHSIFAVAILFFIFVASAQSLPRLAVLVDDASVESRNLADLMQAELSNNAAVEVVERAEIERVMREQEFSAAGLVDAETRVQLGKILKANGLVFVGSRHVRVVETSDGFFAGFFMRSPDDTLVRASVALSAGVVELLPKLSRDPELQTCVTLLRFNTVMIGARDAHEHEAKFDALMHERLAAALCAEPDVLVMERRRAWDLLGEAELAGERLRLKPGTLLIDGELASVLAEANTEKPSATLTLRVRDLTGRGIEPVVARGLRSGLETLMEEAASQAVATIRQNLRTGSMDTLKAEFDALAHLGRNTLWASEAAYLMNPKDAEARNELATKLLICDPKLNRAFTSLVERCYAYARLEQIYREDGPKSMQRVFMYRNPDLHTLYKDLAQELTHTNPELRAALQPLRQVLARAVDEAFDYKTEPNLKGRLLAQTTSWVPAIVGTERERNALQRKIFDRVLADENLAGEARDIAIGHYMTQCLWPLEFYREQAGSDDPLRRYYAHYQLMVAQGRASEQARFHANAAADELVSLIKRGASYGMTFRAHEAPRNDIIKTRYAHEFPRNSMQASDRWLLYSVRHTFEIFPDMKELLVRKCFEGVGAFVAGREELSEQDGMRLRLMEPDILFPGAIPDAEFLAWVEETLKKAPVSYKYRAARPQSMAENYDQPRSWLEALLDELITRADDVYFRSGITPKSELLEREVLFTLKDFEEKWRHLRLRWRSTFEQQHNRAKYEASEYLPCRLLLDGGTLWVALAGGVIYNENPQKKQFGLVAIDVATNEIKGGRFGLRETIHHNPTDSHYGRLCRNVQKDGARTLIEPHDYPILPLSRFKDFVMLPHGDEGLAMFPVDAAGAEDLRGVEWLDIHKESYIPRYRNHITAYALDSGAGYLGLNKWFILSCALPGGTPTVIFDGRQEMAGHNATGFGRMVEDLWFDAEQGKLIAVFLLTQPRAANDGQKRGELVQDPRTKAWLAKSGNSAMSYNPKTGEWAPFDNVPKRESIAETRMKAAREALEKDRHEFIVDVAPIDDTTFYALVGYGTRWRLEKVRMKK